MQRWIQWSLMGMAALMFVSTVAYAQEEGQQRRRQRGGQQRGGQGGPGGRGGFGGGRTGGFGGGNMRATLLGIDAVKEEIDLLPDQDDDVKKAIEAGRTAGRGQQGGERPNFREMSEEDRNKYIADIRARMKKASDELDKKIDDILIPPQIERLDEIALQVQGPQALLSSEKVAKALKISAAQKKEIEEAQQEARDSMREKARALFQGGNRENMREAFAKLQKDVNDALMKPLSGDQKKQFEKMKGEPFKMPEGALRGGRGGFGGGGRGGPGGRGGQGGAGGRPARPQRPGNDN